MLTVMGRLLKVTSRNLPAARNFSSGLRAIFMRDSRRERARIASACASCNLSASPQDSPFTRADTRITPSSIDRARDGLRRATAPAVFRPARWRAAARAAREGRAPRAIACVRARGKPRREAGSRRPPQRARRRQRRADRSPPAGCRRATAAAARRAPAQPRLSSEAAARRKAEATVGR